MKHTNITISGRPATLTITDRYKNETDRMARAVNISVFLQDNWEVLSSIGEAISSKRLRDLMIGCIGQEIKNSKGHLLASLPSRTGDQREIRSGDDRAHSDTVGEHCLRLECEDRTVAGKRTKVILLNGTNKDRVDKYLTNFSKAKVPVID